MKLSLVAAAAVSLSAPLVRAVAVPADSSGPALVPRPGPIPPVDGALDAPLVRRKGGGHGSSGGGHSSSSGHDGSSSSSSGSSGSADSASHKGAGATSSNAGGRTTTGSGVKPAYGDGAYYSGGTAVPYRSGQTSPSGVVPVALGFSAGASLAFWPGVWHHPVYYYPYPHPYAFYNRSAARNETRAVACGCDATVECSCDANTNSTYMDSLLGNGSYAALDKSVVTVGDVNGTTTLLVNGTLANGTTAAGGTDSPSAGSGMHVLLESAGYGPALAAVAAAVFVL